MRPEVAKALRGALATVVEAGTARRVAGAFKDAAGKPIVTGGKTGSGDNRFKTFARGGFLKSSRAVNRTATFTFYIGDRYFGVLTAFVPGQESDQYEFTSALSVSVLRLLAPAINARIAGKPIPEQPDADALAKSREAATHRRLTQATTDCADGASAKSVVRRPVMCDRATSLHLLSVCLLFVASAASATTATPSVTPTGPLGHLTVRVAERPEGCTGSVSGITRAAAAWQPRRDHRRVRQHGEVHRAAG